MSRFDTWPLDGNDLTTRLAGWWSKNHWLFTEGDTMYTSGQMTQTKPAVYNMPAPEGIQPMTPLQSRLNDLHDATSGLESVIGSLYQRFAHLLPSLPPDTDKMPGTQVEAQKSEVSLRLDDAVGRIRRCVRSAELLMERVEA